MAIQKSGAIPASMALVVGDTIPLDRVLNDHDGKPTKLGDLVGKKNLVLYFYPLDYTPGCTAQACSFRDDIEEFSGLDAEIVGVSKDGQEKHASFRQRYNLPFTLLSDPGNKLASEFGVQNKLGLLPGRATFVIDREGVIRAKYQNQFMATKHVSAAKQALLELQV